MAIVFLSLGSNIGNKQANMASALTEIEKRVGVVCQKSAIYETGAWGFESDNFLNQVIEVRTGLNPHLLINSCLEIEKEMGRERNNHIGYSSRIIDIDILFYDDLVLLEENLVIPHPHIQNRKFILVPLNEIIPHFKHPKLQKSISQLLIECQDKGMVQLANQQ
jgi:deoxyguanosine kinase